MQCLFFLSFYLLIINSSGGSYPIRVPVILAYSNQRFVLHRKLSCKAGIVVGCQNFLAVEWRSRIFCLIIRKDQFVRSTFSFWPRWESDLTTASSIFLLGRFCDRRMFRRFEVRHKLQIYIIASEKIMARVECSSLETSEFYEASALLSELAGPGRCDVCFAAKIFWTKTKIFLQKNFKLF